MKLPATTVIMRLFVVVCIYLFMVGVDSAVVPSGDRESGGMNFMVRREEPLLTTTRVGSQSFSCPSPWAQFRGSCYFFGRRNHDWFASQSICESLGANLISVTTPEENEFIRESILDDAFLGYTDMNGDGLYEWNDNNPVDYENWATGQPDPAENEEEGCVVMTYDGKWISQHCAYHKNYACKFSPPPVFETSCEDGWLLFSNYCYKFNMEYLTWNEARQSCRDIGGGLASIWTPEENEFIRAHIELNAFIGLSDLIIEGTFEWTDGSPMVWENWDDVAINDMMNYNNEQDCVTIMPQTGKWNDKWCNFRYDYVCKKEAYVMCPYGWVNFEDSCYLFSNIETDFPAAVLRCADLGAHIVTVNNYEENGFIQGQLAGSNKKAFLGYNDINREGWFVWTDREIINYENWDIGEPNNHPFNEDCTEMTSGGYWNDIECSANKHYICEKDYEFSTPTSRSNIYTTSTSSEFDTSVNDFL